MVDNSNFSPGSRRRNGAGALTRVTQTRMFMTVEDTGSPDRFDDEHYPAYTMGRAAEMIGATAAFLRSVEAAKLFDPSRSEGGHRRYSRYQLRLAARVRDIADQGTGVEAAGRIVILEDQLAEALELNQRYERGERATGGAAP